MAKVVLVNCSHRGGNSAKLSKISHVTRTSDRRSLGLGKDKQGMNAALSVTRTTGNTGMIVNESVRCFFEA